jgi:hypothetical protein
VPEAKNKGLRKMLDSTSLTPIQIRGRSLAHHDTIARVSLAADIVERGATLCDVPGTLAACICGVARGAVVRELRRRGQAPRARLRRSPSVATCLPIIASAPVEVRSHIAAGLPAETLLDLAATAEARRTAAE